MNFENFNDAEALKIAINMENEGLSFYTTLTENTQSEDAKEIFSRLAQEEKEHVNIFQKAYDELPSSTEPMQGSEDYTVDLYLRDLVNTGVFTQTGKAKHIALSAKTDVEALKIGIQAEKDAILYYSEAASNTKSEAGKKMFGQLVAEEKRHLSILVEHLHLLQKK